MHQVIRHVREHRLIAAAQTVRSVEKVVTRACVTQHNAQARAMPPRPATMRAWERLRRRGARAQERGWLTTVRALLHGLRARTAEAVTALREFDEAAESIGWRAAQGSGGVRTEWRPAADGSLWIRMSGELAGASLLHLAAVAYEVQLWPRWVPLCGGAEVVAELSKFERVIWMQWELPMLRRGTLMHWVMSDQLLEKQSLTLLGASVPESPSAPRPPAASAVTLAEMRAVKILVRPTGPDSCAEIAPR